MNTSAASAPPAHPDPLPPPQRGGPGDLPGSAPGASLVLRVPDAVDPDGLGARLGRLWAAVSETRRATPRVDLSIVETCGRTRAERERDALRLLGAEAEAAPGTGTLRATLVCVGAREHLLLLCAAGACAATVLARIAAELGRTDPGTPDPAR